MNIEELMKLYKEYKKLAPPIRGFAVTQEQYEDIKEKIKPAVPNLYDSFLSPSPFFSMEVRIVPEGEPAPEGFTDMRYKHYLYWGE